MLAVDKFQSAQNAINTNSQRAYGAYWTDYYPNYRPISYYYYPHPADQKLKFALELIATGDFSKDEIAQIAKAALK